MKHIQSINDKMSQYGISKSQLAGAIGASESTISRILRGKMRLSAETACMIARALQMSASDLMVEQAKHEASAMAATIDLANVRKLVDNRQDI